MNGRKGCDGSAAGEEVQDLAGWHRRESDTLVLKAVSALSKSSNCLLGNYEVPQNFTSPETCNTLETIQ